MAKNKNLTIDNEERRWCIYMHKTPSGKIYIGQTVNVEERWRPSAYDQCIKFHNSIKKYGWDKIEHKILFSNLSFLDANMIEQDLIFYYKKLKISLNITDGGQGSKGRKQSEYSKQLISQKNKGKPGWNKGIPMREESKLKLIKSITGRKLTEEHKLKIKNNWHGGKPAKAILQIDSSGNIINRFASISEAERFFGKKKSHIFEVLQGKRKHAFKYYWKLEE